MSDKWVTATGDAPKVDATRRYFAELRASLSNAMEVTADLAGDVRRLRLALTEIADKARWYAENDQRDPHEVDHALCVEVLDMAERALEADA